MTAYDSYTIGTAEYKRAFWDKTMRSGQVPYDLMQCGNSAHDTLLLPAGSDKKFQEALRRESVFRQVATCISTPQSEGSIWTSVCEDLAEWTPEGGAVSVMDATGSFTRHCTRCNKLAVIAKVTNNYVQDIGFDVEGYLTVRLAKAFGRAEENAFINGTGDGMPTGILHSTEGAETGLSATEINFDSMAELYLSVKPEFRKNGVWMMNDETALTLRTLKDKNGGYLWNHNSDAIFGKPVHISEFMPSAAPGSLPVAFGDFSHYWIVSRLPLSVRVLTERYSLQHQTGYLAYEFLDGRLTRPEAIKVLQITGK
jgi:HK97 family phage major capsid protein